MRFKFFSLAAICACAGFAQQFELGGLVGYGVYRNGTLSSPSGTASAGIHNGVTAGAVFCDDLYEHISGEFRYLYQDGGPFISGSGKSSLSGQTHTFAYDLLFQINGREQRIRPFFAAGVGAKDYADSGTGTPLSVNGIGNLVNGDQWLLVGSVGGGVKFRVNRNFLVRADFRDYFSTFPRHVIMPVAGGGAQGILHQFTPLFGASYTF